MVVIVVTAVSVLSGTPSAVSATSGFSVTLSSFCRSGE